ncbi:DUF3291 domain-containing protein [Pseudomonas benzenivorans]|uniref:DUF3291 domain-containing protein n=1 Tax=Pseudomonas benzenivorans TaxID=556533 RepID=A0ABZ0Q310_9PSED|nr:DUF3291 domain-containing protein [Pseudomonas benzenivorans]WPC07070.1 DUF3291 domain-containing protein [Pseudomonas benzenivorans]
MDETRPRTYQLAQVNIARALAPLDSPTMQGFVEQLDPINRLAEASPGFVWRLQTEEGDATALRVFADERIIVNLSVWDSLEALQDFVYGSAHLNLLRNKKQWFEKPSEPILALWWVPSGHIPSIEEAKQALATLRAQGPSPSAFSFASPFAQPGKPTAKHQLQS